MLNSGVSILTLNPPSPKVVATPPVGAGRAARRARGGAAAATGCAATKEEVAEEEEMALCTALLICGWSAEIIWAIKALWSTEEEEELLENPVFEAVEVAPENLDPELELVTFDPEANEEEEVGALAGCGLISTNPACSEDV